ncbi:MAG: hypothetical protein QOF49_950 [Chloroflexota bacterium]|jgi:uncharacterized membrane-anchored protein YitT (DUF2179 family)|nr:hypothetical protein [Chloroflexota bacterium]
MTVHLSRPDRIQTRFLSTPVPRTHRLVPPGVILGVIARGLLVGLGLGAVLVAGGTSAVGIVVAGFLAIGASLVSWTE